MARQQFNRLLTKSDVEEIRSALVFYYPQMVGEAARPDPGKFSTRNFTWPDRNDFDNDISFVAGTNIAGLKGDALYRSLKTVDRNLNGLVGSNPVEGNRPTKEQLETFEAEDEAARAKRKEIAESVKKEIDDSINKQQKIQESLRDKKLYAKVEAAQTPSPQNPDQINVLKEQAAISPKNIEEDLYPGIKTAIESNLTGQLSPEEIEFLARKTALDTAKGLANPSEQIANTTQSAILAKMAQDPSLSPEIRAAASEIFFSQNQIVSRNIMMAINPDIAWAAFGANPTDYKVSFSGTQVDGATNSIDFSQLNQGYINLLQNQGAFFNNVGSLAQTEAKNFLMGQARLWLDGKIASLSPEIQGIYNSGLVQNSLNFVGFGKAVSFGETALGEFILKIPGAPSFLEGAGRVTGINFLGGAAGKVGKEAVKTIGKDVAVEVGGKAIASTGLKIAGGAGLAATLTAAFAWTGPLAPVIGTVGAFLVETAAWKLVGKIWNGLKDLASKYGKALIVGTVALIGFLFGGPLAGLGAGLGAYGLLSFLGGGLSGLQAAGSSLFSGIGAAAGVIWATFLAGVGMPLLVSFLAFPVVVVLILFIINSGAFVVPPSPRSADSGAVITSPYIDVIKKANPGGPFENSDLPLDIEYSITIKAKKGPLTNVRIDYNCRVVKENASVACPDPVPDIPTPGSSDYPETIPPAGAYTFTYKGSYGSSDFTDAFVTDVITVTADTIEQAGAKAAGSATIKIGEPPEECPSVWPTAGGHVSQGAYVGTHSALEAIDIGVSHVPVMATHTGVVLSAQTDSCYGNNVKIKSNCGGRDYYSRYAHLEAMNVRTGQVVTMGQTIGLSGNTTGGRSDCSTGPHLHYDFRYLPSGNPKWPSNPPFMMSPYIPQDVPRGCANTAACGVSW